MKVAFVHIHSFIKLLTNLHIEIKSQTHWTVLVGSESEWWHGDSLSNADDRIAQRTDVKHSTTFHT